MFIAVTIIKKRFFFNRCFQSKEKKIIGQSHVIEITGHRSLTFFQHWLNHTHGVVLKGNNCEYYHRSSIVESDERQM